MSFFRSEEHIRRWLDGRPGGATIGVEQLADLAYQWWGDRLADDWRPRTRDQSQAILTAVGLTDPFWTLP